jgi:hypothetical protein
MADLSAETISVAIGHYMASVKGVTQAICSLEEEYLEERVGLSDYLRTIHRGLPH